MTSIKTGPSRPGSHLLAIPAAVTVILFLGYSSQWLFHKATYLAPGPLTTRETVVFNTLLGCLWWTYFRACMTDPGRYVFDHAAAPDSSDAVPATKLASVESDASSESSASSRTTAVRWCKKCDAPKPPRAHHCRHCARCVPKMDHHCPWTGNCVSMQTFPHFLRFVVFTNAALWYLVILLSARFYGLYDQRHLPAYLGPTLAQLLHLTMLGFVCAATLLALTIMLYNTMQSWLFNTTMIESWEVDRHEAVVARYNSTSANGTWWDENDKDSDLSEDDDDDDYDEEGDYAYEKNRGTGATDVDVDKERKGAEKDKNRRSHGRSLALRRHVEFPYDLGFFDNMAQAMGTRNLLLWFFPLAGAPTIAPGGSGAGWDWPENGFNDQPGMWPPPDPEKRRFEAAVAARGGVWSDNGAATGAGPAAFASGSDNANRSPEEDKAAFQARQAADFRQRAQRSAGGGAVGGGSPEEEEEEGMDGEPGWTNADGDRLRDYGVDEEAEQDEDEVPLARLKQKRVGAGQKSKKER